LQYVLFNDFFFVATVTFKPFPYVYSHECGSGTGDQHLPCDVQDSKAQVTALQLIIGTLQRTRVFGVENRDTLTHKATGVNNLSNRFHLVALPTT
jgi:hypothetical protein